MSQEARRGRRAGKIMLQLYREWQPLIEQLAEHAGVTCRAGCAHCCMLPATATVPEMVPVVEHLVGSRDWDSRRPALTKALEGQLSAYAGIDFLDPQVRADLFRRQLPCVFLREGRCTIYSIRPAVCRFHMVVSPPENCAEGAADPSVAIVDLRGAQTEIAVRGAEAFGELRGGPIARALVAAADVLGDDLSVDRDLVDRVPLVRRHVGT